MKRISHVWLSKTWLASLTICPMAKCARMPLCLIRIFGRCTLTRVCCIAWFYKKYYHSRTVWTISEHVSSCCFDCPKTGFQPPVFYCLSGVYYVTSLRPLQMEGALKYSTVEYVCFNQSSSRSLHVSLQCTSICTKLGKYGNSYQFLGRTVCHVSFWLLIIRS